MFTRAVGGLGRTLCGAPSQQGVIFGGGECNGGRYTVPDQWSPRVACSIGGSFMHHKERARHGSHGWRSPPVGHFHIRVMFMR